MLQLHKEAWAIALCSWPNIRQQQQIKEPWFDLRLTYTPAPCACLILEVVKAFKMIEANKEGKNCLINASHARHKHRQLRVTVIIILNKKKRDTRDC